MKRIISALVFLTLLMPLLASSQVPVQAFIPEAGFWWNPNQSGRGYAIEVQDRLLFITAYVYTEEGDSSIREPLWFTAVGEVGVDTSNGVVYDLTTEFNFSEDGQCFGCPYVPPTTTGTGRQLTLRFDSVFSGELTVDNEVIPIQRLWYSDSQTVTNVMLGQWMFVTDFSQAVNGVLPFEGDMIEMFRNTDDFLVEGIRSATNIAVAGSVSPDGQSYVVVVAETPTLFLAYYWDSIDIGTDKLIGLAERYVPGTNITGQGFPLQGRRISDRTLTQDLNGVVPKKQSQSKAKENQPRLDRPTRKVTGKTQLDASRLASLNLTIRSLELKLEQQLKQP